MSIPTSGYKLWSNDDLKKLLDNYRAVAICKLRCLRTCVGGQPATDRGLEDYIEHFLKIDPQRLDGNKKNPPTSADFLAAFKRIKGEIGERDLTPETGEVKEEKVYGINVIRRSEHGPYLLEHQIKALLKQSASRMGLFMAHRGSKGDLAEMGTVMAIGDSLQNPARPWEIYLRKDGKAATTEFTTMRGSVSTAQGRKSIQYEAEVCCEGAEIEFELRWPPNRLTRDIMAEIFAGTLSIGLGSALSLGHGRFEIVALGIEERKTQGELVAEAKPKKAKKGQTSEAVA